MSLLRRSLVLGAAALALGATTASAQMMGKPKEVRIDMASFTSQDGNTDINLVFPGNLAVAIYMNDNIAIEPFVMLRFQSGNGFSGGQFGLGVQVPYYLAGGMGKTGFFIAPGVGIDKGFGDGEYDVQTNYGLDLGLKREWKGAVGQRFALTLRDGDAYPEMEFGVVAGITVRWP